jgi:hypothetical protein
MCDSIRTLFGLKLNRLIPSRRIVFRCLALAKRSGSSGRSGVVTLDGSWDEIDGVSRSEEVLGFPSEEARGFELPGSDAVTGSARTPFSAVVPHATRDLSTETRHSRAWRLMVASLDEPFAGSVAVASADVLREGGTALLLAFKLWPDVGLVKSPLFPVVCGCTLEIFETMLIKLFKSALSREGSLAYRTVHICFPVPHCHSRS